MESLRGPWRWAAWILCLLLVIAAIPTPSFATNTGQKLADKQAQATKAEAELATLRSELTAALAGLDRVSSLMDGLSQEQADTKSELVQLNLDIVESETRLNQRAVDMYKWGGLDVVELLLTTRSLREMIDRLDLISFVQQRDLDLQKRLITDREQSAYLQQRQSQREVELVNMKKQADARRVQVESLLAKQQTMVASLGTEVAALVTAQEAEQAAAAAADAASGLPTPPVAFDPNTLVSDATYLASTSMNAASIQAFLDGRGGALRSYSGRDHAGVTKTAAEMIADAAAHWGVSPKVILVTLQKEQSLLEAPNPSQNAYDWAMGCGKTDSVTYTQYKGFGKQVWSGADKLRHDGDMWRRGISLNIDGTAVYPTNASTLSLYRYTPHFGGASSFWRLYWRYFGDPKK